MPKEKLSHIENVDHNYFDEIISRWTNRIIAANLMVDTIYYKNNKFEVTQPEQCIIFYLRSKKELMTQYCLLQSLRNVSDCNISIMQHKVLWYMAIQYGTIDDMRWLLNSQIFEDINIDSISISGIPLLHYTILLNKLHMTEILLLHGADINLLNDMQETSLYRAIWHGNIEATKLLLEKGADINSILPDGDTSLHKAVSFDHIDICYLLLSHGVDVNILDHHKNTPLHTAVIHSRYKICEVLLKKGANVNLPNNKGQTSLHLTIYSANITITNLLLDHGAEVNARDHDGNTALDLANIYRVKNYYACEFPSNKKTRDNIYQLLLNKSNEKITY